MVLHGSSCTSFVLVIVILKSSIWQSIVKTIWNVACHDDKAFMKVHCIMKPLLGNVHGMFTRLWVNGQSMKRTVFFSWYLKKVCYTHIHKLSAGFLLSVGPKEKMLEISMEKMYHRYEITDIDIFQPVPFLLLQTSNSMPDWYCIRAVQSFVTMNLHGGHFLFREPKHDARWSSCCLLQNVE